MLFVLTPAVPGIGRASSPFQFRSQLRPSARLSGTHIDESRTIPGQLEPNAGRGLPVLERQLEWRELGSIKQPVGWLTAKPYKCLGARVVGEAAWDYSR